MREFAGAYSVFWASCSDAGEEVSADPLKLRLPEVSAPVRPARPVVDELRYSDADWAEATRRRDLLAALASKTARTAADVAAAATCLGVSPRRVWGLLRRSPSHCSEITPFLPARRRTRAKRLSAGREAIIQQAIDQHYAKRARPSLQSLANEVAVRCRAVGLTPPSTKTIRARVRGVTRSGWLAGARERARPVPSPCRTGPIPAPPNPGKLA
jgi:hypothetical protein